MQSLLLLSFLLPVLFVCFVVVAMQNLAQSSPTQKSSSSSPQHPPLGTFSPTQSTGGSSPSAGGGHSGGSAENVIITPLLQVGEVRSAGEGGGSSLAVAVGAGEGGSGSGVERPGVHIGVEDLSGGTKRSNKRKPSDLIDPPPGTPTCPVCQKEFTSWKAAFGHMRAHPERVYRGFFRPPVFSSTSSSPAPPAPAPQAVQAQGDSGSGEGGSSSSTAGPSGITFDLNQPMEGVESNAAEKTDEGKKNYFDLNELPAEDDEDKP